VAGDNERSRRDPWLRKKSVYISEDGIREFALRFYSACSVSAAMADNQSSNGMGAKSCLIARLIGGSVKPAAAHLGRMPSFEINDCASARNDQTTNPTKGRSP
jgi:hypothetical protein